MNRKLKVGVLVLLLALMACGVKEEMNVMCFPGAAILLVLAARWLS